MPASEKSLNVAEAEDTMEHTTSDTRHRRTTQFTKEGPWLTTMISSAGGKD
jgi:hypothetical protein